MGRRFWKAWYSRVSVCPANMVARTASLPVFLGQEVTLTMEWRSRQWLRSWGSTNRSSRNPIFTKMVTLNQKVPGIPCGTEGGTVLWGHRKPPLAPQFSDKIPHPSSGDRAQSYLQAWGPHSQAPLGRGSTSKVRDNPCLGSTVWGTWRLWGTWWS